MPRIENNISGSQESAWEASGLGVSTRPSLEDWGTIVAKELSQLSRFRLPAEVEDRKESMPRELDRPKSSAGTSPDSGLKFSQAPGRGLDTPYTEAELENFEAFSKNPRIHQRKMEDPRYAYWWILVQREAYPEGTTSSGGAAYQVAPDVVTEAITGIAKRVREGAIINPAMASTDALGELDKGYGQTGQAEQEQAKPAPKTGDAPSNPGRREFLKKLGLASLAMTILGGGALALSKGGQQQPEGTSTPTPTSTPDASPTSVPATSKPVDIEPGNPANPNVDPRAKALIDLPTEQRNVILVGDNVQLDNSLGELTFDRDGLSFRYDPNRATAGAPESGKVVVDGSGISANGNTTIFVDNLGNTQSGNNIDPFKGLKVKDQSALDAIANMYDELSALSGSKEKHAVRFVITDENVGEVGKLEPGWQLLTRDGSAITLAVKKGEVGDQKEISIFTNNLDLPRENRTRWLYGTIASAAIEDASPQTWSSPNKIQEYLNKYNVGELRNNAFEPIS